MKNEGLTVQERLELCANLDVKAPKFSDDELANMSDDEFRNLCDSFIARLTQSLSIQEDWLQILP